VASFVFLTSRNELKGIAGHPVYRDLLSLLLYTCSVGNSGQITRHVRIAYDPQEKTHEVAKYVRGDLHTLVQAGLLARAPILLPPPTIGEAPLATCDRETLEARRLIAPENPLHALAEEIVRAAAARTPPVTSFKTLNVYHATEETRSVFKRYGDPKRRLGVEYGELFAFGMTGYYAAEDLASNVIRSPADVADCVRGYQALAQRTTDLLDLTSHELVFHLAYAELVFRLRQAGTDRFNALLRHTRFHFAHPRTTVAELRTLCLDFLGSKPSKDRLEIW
jgi:hypothetical protein